MTTPPAIADTAASATAEPTYEAQLAMTGLATQLASPALMHGLRGRLHNLGLLTELLQKETAKQTDVATLRTSTSRRVETIRKEIEALYRQVQLLEALTLDDAEKEDDVCDIRASFDELLPTLRFEAARRGVVIRLDVEPAVERIHCGPSAFQQLMLAFASYTVRHCSERSTVTVSAVRDGESINIAFDCDRPLESEAHARDRTLLGLLALRVGARVSESTSSLRITFESAP